MSNFSGKVVFITGASSGIGAALAREFAAQGAHLLLMARRADRLQALADELGPRGIKVVTYVGDVTKAEDLSQAIAAGRTALGPMDVVIANAGFGVGGRLDQLSLEDYQRQFETNVFGVLRTIYASLDDLKQTRGRLAVVGSVASYLPLPTSSAYSMSKFAVRALCWALHDELRRNNVSVTHIAPGFVQTEFFRVDKSGVFRADAPDRVKDWMKMPADKAARQIARAIHRRKREAVITFHGKVGVWFQRHLPWLVSSAIRWGVLKKVGSGFIQMASGSNRGKLTEPSGGI